MCFVWIWEQTAITSLYSINWMVCVRETVCLLCGTDWVLKNTSLKSENYVHKHPDGKNIIVISMQTLRAKFSAVDFNLPNEWKESNISAYANYVKLGFV